ncbi:MAG: LytTR family DNA-binding domain-containing protein [Bacillota bacterium]
MKLKILLNPDDPLWEEIRQKGIENDETSEYVLSRKGGDVRYLSAKKDEQTFFVPVEDIIYIDSLGHDVMIHTMDGVYTTKERLKQLEADLDSERFLRVSNSAIIATGAVRRIEASILQKFILHMTNGDKVDVTRSYYYIFRDRFSL